MTKTFFPLPVTLLFLFTNSLIAQHTIQGKLVTETNEPIVFANVILLNAEDSTSVYKGTISEDNGEFLFEEIASNDYLLKVSFVGYEEYLQQISVNSDKKIRKITLKEGASNLEEVTINARKPKITRSIDRITFDVENSTLSSGSSWDILRQTPGVIIAQGQLQVRNSSVTVYINDRKVQLTADELQTLLQSYSAENIKSIEVITNPPARYEAEGGAILNINTTSAISPGYKGSLEGAYTQGIVPKYQFGTSHYWKGDKLNVFANYTFSPRKEIKRDDSYINFSPNEEFGQRWESDFERVTRSQAHNANVILDYDFDEKNKLSFSSNLFFSPDKTFDNSVRTDITTQGNTAFSNFMTDSEVGTDEHNIGLDLTYTHKLENGGSFSAAAHYTRFNQERDQKVATNYFDSAGENVQNINFNTSSGQNIEIFTGQLDFNSSLGEMSFDAGAKVSNINSNSGINFSNAESLDDLYDNLSDDFYYDETVSAVYINTSRDWEKWSAQVGLRGEYTDLLGVSLSTNQRNRQEYFELFPTAYLQYRASDNHSFTLDYSRRIERPRYESLNPFRYFLNENDFNAGNPNLRAAISNNINLNYTLLGQYFFDVYYRDNGRSPASLAFQDNQNLTIRRLQANLLESKSYGLDILHGRSITGWWYAQLYASLFHEENTFLAVESNNAEVTNEIDAVFGQLYNSFTLSKDGTFSGNLSFTYVSDYITGSYNFDPFSTLSLGVRKTLWNNRAELSLNINDIFNNTNTRLTSQYLNQDNSYFAQEEMRYVRVGFKYNFGNFRLEDNQRSIDAVERNRL
ncbi:Outer membrane receptor proteins, mostly Fe transport [Salegentibacter agarivorans]|uniref:Outer membrane receptor proteins, mostly Fe transport n=1 Tax=Salegentibacter agarivorans TaxID=345907 RepID=A0A1I2MG38_9FLAO|nr:outer membrane beta-barrel family protein [Salegentibacter agarivorans]SFF89739.1 Outer membrane receptor proteins, mostly Fe transport [Salegentibacter agarivorans]